MEIVEQARAQRLLSGEHFSADGMRRRRIGSVGVGEPYAAQRREPIAAFRGQRTRRNPEVDCRGKRRSNETHRFTNVLDARLAKNGKRKAAKLCSGVNALMDVCLTPSAGTLEGEAALEMLNAVPGARRTTVGADRGYDARGFVARCRKSRAMPHVAQKRPQAICRRTSRHDGYRFSQRARKRVEEVFGWVKTVAGGRKLRYCGVERNRFWMEMTTTSYILLKLAKPTPMTA